MVANCSAILAICMLAAPQLLRGADDEVAKPSAEELYAQASAALGLGETAQAVTLLERMRSAIPLPVGLEQGDAISTHSVRRDRVLHRLANFHLAELYAHAGDSRAALETLTGLLASDQDWQQLVTVAPEMQNRWLRIAEMAAHTLEVTAANERLLAEYVQHIDSFAAATESLERTESAWSDHGQRVMGELARRYEHSSSYRQALEIYQRLLRDTTSVANAVDPAAKLKWLEAWQTSQLRIVLKLASGAKVRDDHAAAEAWLATLRRAAWLTRDQRQLVELAWCDALAASGRRDQALDHLEHLAKTERTSSAAADSQAWLGNIELRRAEHLAKVGRWAEASRVALASASEFPEYPVRHEMFYLAGRSAVEQANLDAARGYFAQAAAAADADADAEVRGRCQWMIGETYFLQRDYRRAMAAYAPLTSLPDADAWRLRSLLQSGKCHELLKQRREAVESYRSFLKSSLADDRFDAERDLATERIAALDTPGQ